MIAFESVEEHYAWVKRLPEELVLSDLKTSDDILDLIEETLPPLGGHVLTNNIFGIVIGVHIAYHPDGEDPFSLKIGESI